MINKKIPGACDAEDLKANSKNHRIEFSEFAAKSQSKFVGPNYSRCLAIVKSVRRHRIDAAFAALLRVKKGRLLPKFRIDGQLGCLISGGWPLDQSPSSASNEGGGK